MKGWIKTSSKDTSFQKWVYKDDSIYLYILNTDKVIVEGKPSALSFQRAFDALGEKESNYGHNQK